MSIMVNHHFRYTSLLQILRDEGAVSANLATIFDQLNTTDFELVLRKLDDTHKILSILGKSDFLPNIDALRNECRTALIEAVSKVCPEIQSQSPLDSDAVNSELTKYDRVFTTNYDVILYWCCKKLGKFNIDDRFRKDGFSPESDSELTKMFFLHGAMHIFDEGTRVVKEKHDKDSGFDGVLVKRIKSRINGGQYPIFVTEGAPDQKLAKIRSNRYLNYCFDSLNGTEGEIDVFGHSLREEFDQHIVDALSLSRLDKINLYIYEFFKHPGDGSVLAAKIKKHFKGEVAIFDSSEHPISKIWHTFD